MRKIGYAALLGFLGMVSGGAVAGVSGQVPPIPANATPSMMFDGECIVVQATNNSIGWEGGFYPASVIGAYFSNVQHTELDTSKTTINVLQGPSHGRLVDTGKIGDGPYYEYRATPAYLGPDEATLLIEISGKSYESHIKFYVVEKVNDNNFYGWNTPATRCAESRSERVDLKGAGSN